MARVEGDNTPHATLAEERIAMTLDCPRLRRVLVRTLTLIGLGATLSGCYYVVPAYPPPPGAYVGPAPVYAPGRWVWNGYAWVWQPGYWTAPVPAPPPAGQAPPPASMPQAPAAPQQNPPAAPGGSPPRTN